MTDAIIRDGSFQDARFPEAMAPGYFNVDESTFEDLVAQAAEFSSCLKFTDLNDKPGGDWQALFASDEAVLFALMAGVDPDKILQRFIHLSDHQDLAGLKTLVAELFSSVKRWYKALSAINSSHARAGGRRIGYLMARKLDRLPASFDSPDHDQAMQQLNTGFYALHSCVVMIRSHARVLLEASLTSQSHGPAPGLFLAFVQLYDRVRAIQNRFTLRHLDFYYEKVLAYRPRGPEPDQAYLCFVKAPQAEPVLIPEGTRFPAPQEKPGKPKVYRAAHDLLVTPAKIESLKTLLFETHPLSSPESALGMVTGIRKSQIPVKAPAEFKPGREGAPFFGLGSDGEPNPGEAGQAGVALSSPILMLAEGDRRLSLVFTLAGTGDKQFEKGLFSGLLGRAATLSGTTPEVMFFRIFPKAFSIRVTAAQGWHEVPVYVPATALTDPGLGPDQFCLSFELDANDPPVVPYSPALHGKGYDTKFPVMELLISAEAYVYPFSILEDYEILGLEVTGRVRGLKNIQLYNHLGRLDPNGPFQPLGPLPEKGSYLVAGCHEAAVKHLTRFMLDLEWGGLPPEGFRDHYTGYGKDLENPSFRAVSFRLRDGMWQAGPGLPLFEETAGPGISPNIRLDSGPLDLHGDPGLGAAEFAYTVRARSGFFKFGLDTPATGFGHQAYPYLLTRVLTDNARKGRFKLADPLPKPPYTPVVTAASVSYEARAGFSPGLTASGSLNPWDTLFQIHPFGVKKLYPLENQPSCPLVPQDLCQGRGSLFIGLSGLIPGARLSLFFVLTETAGAASTRDLPLVSWFYLKDNTWHPIPKHQVAMDTTQGFLCSGLVCLDLPRDLARGNTLMGEDLYWLRVTAHERLGGPAGLFTVHANGLLVSLEDPEAALTRLAPGSIKAPMTLIPGITGVVQPLEGGGGRPPEERKMRNIRMSERLKHKNRAVSPWDFERLILDRFPQVEKVKCFPGISSASYACWEQRNARGTHGQWACETCGRYGSSAQPGHVLVSIIPKVDRASLSLSRDAQPRADAALLSQIKHFLEERVSPFSAIEVTNPVYEKIQVRCAVRFSDGHGELGARQRLNRDIWTFLSPWQPGGYQAGFGWQIRRTDLIAHIQSLSYVDFVTRFSMLRLSRAGENCFELFDSVTPGAVKPSQDEKLILPKVPWSLAINADRHFIQTTTGARPMMPVRTGLEELEVGNTFIITG